MKVKRDGDGSARRQDPIEQALPKVRDLFTGAPGGGEVSASALGATPKEAAARIVRRILERTEVPDEKSDFMLAGRRISLGFPPQEWVEGLAKLGDVAVPELLDNLGRKVSLAKGGEFLELRYWVLSALQRIGAPQGGRVNVELENQVIGRLSGLYRHLGYMAVDGSDSAVPGDNPAVVMYEAGENAAVMNVPYEMWGETGRRPFIVAELSGSGELSFREWLRRLDQKDRGIREGFRGSGYRYEIRVGERRLSGADEKFTYDEARRGGIWVYKKV
jgi:hypothetical protein